MVRDLSIFNWPLVEAQIAIPLPVGLAIAWLLWRKGQWIIGNVVGSGAILVGTAVCFFNQFVNGLRLSAACDEQGLICMMHPSLFMTLATFVTIGFVQIAILYLVGASAEQRAATRVRWQQAAP